MADKSSSEIARKASTPSIALCMDSAAYLHRQGWRGHGHSLDHSNNGLKKPLLVSKKVDVLGVGLNKHAAVSDQWWLKAYDQGLKDFGTGKQSVLGNVQKHGVNRGGLYGRFVKGEGVPGTIGQSLPSTVDSKSVNATTPAEMQGEPTAKPAVALASGSNVGRKRKRAGEPDGELIQPKIKRLERSESKGEDERQPATKDHAAAAAYDKRERMQDIERRANNMVREAQKRGIIPAPPDNPRSKGSFNTAVDTHDLSNIVDKLIPEAVPIARANTKAGKYERERMKRELKRAARAYLLGEEAPPVETKEEKRARKEKKAAEKALKQGEVKARKAEQAAGREARALKKKEARLQRLAENKADGRGVANPDAVQAAVASNFSLDINADEVKLNVESQKKKKIPGLGVVDAYPSKAEKKATKAAALAAAERGMSADDMQAQLVTEKDSEEAAEKEKIDRYRAAKRGVSLDQYRQKLATGEIQAPSVEVNELSPEKFADYTKRAQKKGISLEAYIKRREEKYAAKQAEKLPIPAQEQVAQSGAKDIAAPPKPANSAAVATAGTLGFVVDTIGGSVFDLATTDPNFSTQAIAAISRGEPFAITDPETNESLKWEPGQPVPQDPRIWADVKAKDLPKPVRKARKEWMVAKRLAKKERQAPYAQAKAEAKKDKGQRKVKAREGFVRQILFESRKAIQSGRGGRGEEGPSVLVTVEGVEGVPLVKVGTGGAFTKGEVSSARTVARRALRNDKRAMKAARGRGKGWKKREREEKASGLL